MILRPVQPGDRPLIDSLMKLKEWPLPEGNYLSQIAVIDDDRAVAFGFSRLVSEAYFVNDPNWRTPAWRWEALKLVHNAARDETVAKGIRKSITWTPNSIAKAYGRRLSSLGWVRQDFPSYVLEVPDVSKCVR
jgi:hypothetical protein